LPSHSELANLVWSVADLLRGDYRQSEYGKVILPFTVLRRLDCVMEPTRAKVRARNEAIDPKNTNKTELLCAAAGLSFYNTSHQTFETIGSDSANAQKNLLDYLDGFSPNAQEIFEKYDLRQQITRLQNAKLLYLVVQRFQDVYLGIEPKYEKDTKTGETVLDDAGQPKIARGPGGRLLDGVGNHAMGYVFEDLIRRFSEISNETAGEHFTPREVIKLMVDLLLAPDDEVLAGPGQALRILDPACGTGGMLTAAEEHIKDLNPNATVWPYGQELNPESYAICRSDMMLKGQDPAHIYLGNSFSDDGHADTKFDYMLANPPFGVEWRKVKDDVEREAARGHAGRFGAGTPRINDGSFLFLQHMLSKMRPVDKGGSRLAIVFNGSPLFTGAAESGESQIRRWILENDLLEGIVALPDQLFYNTGISTYFWILSNRKANALKEKVILLDARDQWAKMRKSLGEKRKQITDEQNAHITTLYRQAVAAAKDPEHPGHSKVKVFATTDFGYHRITVERPLKLRFEITEDTLTALAEAKPLENYADRHALIDAFKPLLGTTWWARDEARNALHLAAAEAAVPWPKAASVLKALWGAVGMSDPEGEIQTAKGETLPDPDLRDYENVPLLEDIDEYFAREVLPHVPDAWIDTTKTKVGYEIPVTRHFYVYTPPRPLAEIDGELRALEGQIQALLGEVAR
jgi:type I restriction enzyme M protein